MNTGYYSIDYFKGLMIDISKINKKADIVNTFKKINSYYDKGNINYNEYKYLIKKIYYKMKRSKL